MLSSFDPHPEVELKLTTPSFVYFYHDNIILSIYETIILWAFLLVKIIVDIYLEATQDIKLNATEISS